MYCPIHWMVYMLAYLYFKRWSCELSIKYECALKNSSNHRVVIRKWALVICKEFFGMTTLWFDEFLNAHSYLILNITNFWLLNLEFANLWSHEVNRSQITNLVQYKIEPPDWTLKWIPRLLILLRLNAQWSRYTKFSSKIFLL